RRDRADRRDASAAHGPPQRRKRRRARPRRDPRDAHGAANDAARARERARVRRALGAARGRPRGDRARLPRPARQSPSPGARGGGVVIWTTWRLQRTETLIAAGLLALLAALLIPTGLNMASVYRHDGLAACINADTSGCGEAITNFTQRFDRVS